MKRFDPSRGESFRKLAREGTVVGDRFTYAVGVVPIKTRG